MKSAPFDGSAIDEPRPVYSVFTISPCFCWRYLISEDWRVGDSEAIPPFAV